MISHTFQFQNMRTMLFKYYDIFAYVDTKSHLQYEVFP